MRQATLRGPGPDTRVFDLRDNYQIPVHVSCDSGVRPEEYAVLLNTVREVLGLIGSRRILADIGKDTVIDYYLSESHGRPDQVDAEKLTRLLMSESYQNYPRTHLEVVLTSLDLYYRDLGFCFGFSHQHHVAIQSVFRFRGEREAIKLALIRKTLTHELGHMFGVPGPVGSHSRIRDQLGPHCSNLCTMRQGYSVSMFKGQMLQEQKAGVIFCPDCLRELRANEANLRLPT